MTKVQRDGEGFLVSAPVAVHAIKERWQSRCRHGDSGRGDTGGNSPCSRPQQGGKDCGNGRKSRRGSVRGDKEDGLQRSMEKTPQE